MHVEQGSHDPTRELTARLDRCGHVVFFFWRTQQRYKRRELHNLVFVYFTSIFLGRIARTSMSFFHAITQHVPSWISRPHHSPLVLHRLVFAPHVWWVAQFFMGHRYFYVHDTIPPAQYHIGVIRFRTVVGRVWYGIYYVTCDVSYGPAVFHWRRHFLGRRGGDVCYIHFAVKSQVQRHYV